MADFNPFLQADDLIENEMVPQQIATMIEITEEAPDISPVIETNVITLDHVATKLIQSNFTLTALELHTELLESGRELPRLRDFFSNPANFERTKTTPSELSPTGLARTSSVQTFDSLDFARYSDDGERQESDRVAVLEFELRKAQETIRSLRDALTKSAETELSSPEAPEDQAQNLEGDEPIKAYEKRAINYLVNEYLMINDYKLTSVTFAEENENQDFEDWDDVGLNIPKPPDFLHLYRDFGQRTSPCVDKKDFSCMAHLDSATDEEQLQEIIQEKIKMTSQIARMDEQIHNIMAENDILSHQLKEMERDADTSRAIPLKSSTPAVSPIKPPTYSTPATHKAPTRAREPPPDGDTAADVDESGVEPLRDAMTSSLESSNGAVNGPTQGAVFAESLPLGLGESADPNHLNNSSQIRNHTMNSLKVEVGSTLSDPNLTVTDSTFASSEQSQTTPFTWQPSRRKLSSAFQSALMSTAFQVSHDNRIIREVSKLTDSSGEKVVLMLGRCLPHIVPNVLLAKREELIPLILCTATLHPDNKERDQLLNILFNLIKRPDMEQRHIILTGCVAFAQHVGPERVETELLPQCWEQITHKYAERRLLVAEACGALSPYLPNEIRSSLVLSMLNQMLQDDKTEEVREAVVRSLGLIMGFIDDPDKFSQGAEMLYVALADSSERVLSCVHHVLLPSYGMWALELGRLQTDLLQSLVDKMERLVQTCPSGSRPSGAPSGPTGGSVPWDRSQFCQLALTVQHLTPLLFAAVLMSAPFAAHTDGADHTEDLPTYSVEAGGCELTRLSVIVGTPERAVSLTQGYQNHISQEWYEPWEGLSWVSGHLIPQLLTLLNRVDLSHPTVVHRLVKLVFTLCRTFGRTFTLSKVKQRFQVVMNIPEDQIDTQVSAGRTPLTKCTVPVYAAGVLSAFSQEEDLKQLTSFLQDLLCTLSICQAPLDSVKAAFVELCLDSNFHDLLLTVLWDGVVHTSANVRSSAARMFESLIKSLHEGLVAARVVPALVTLASDPEISVRISTVPAFGTIMESVSDRSMLDKVYMQLQTFMDDPLYQDQHSLHLELIKTFARVGPNTEPKFRDEFILPRLAVLAAANNHLTNETKKRDLALQLFEAYSALSCCFISDQLIQEALLPGLQCLQADLQTVAPDHVTIVASMAKEMQDKLDSNRLGDKSLGGATPTSAGLPSGEDMKNKMLSRFRDVASHSKSKIFGVKK